MCIGSPPSPPPPPPPPPLPKPDNSEAEAEAKRIEQDAIRRRGIRKTLLSKGPLASGAEATVKRPKLLGQGAGGQ